MIAVIVPAHDEALVIGRCLAAISLAAVHPGLRGEPVLVVVALDDCRDATESVCLMQGVTTLAVKVRCVGAARAAAAAHALSLGARWIASTDADTVVPADWLYRQVNCGADAFCGVVEVVDWLDYPQAVRDAFTGKAVVDGHRHVHGANMGISPSSTSMSASASHRMSLTPGSPGQGRAHLAPPCTALPRMALKKSDDGSTTITSDLPAKLAL